ncbi:MAG: hypothetical protein JOZ90_04145 [Alphaproteobacteria bacterium]|nr:hypothetical protein [Alphaproteobacteria bacterium]MBV9373183.1 hypothetical protein [Alphaproteobacteria bacterium]MBV9900272.1 hypothetical protein [Alphaproteobacteria bacterium]
MPVRPDYPGVYVQEAPSGVHTISGVATSVAAFVGMCPSGPVNVPTRIFSYREFEGLFGGDPYVGELPDQVRQFFLNGGSTAWIVRNARNATDGANMKARSTLLAEGATAAPNQNVLILSAKDAGSGGNLLRVEVDYETANPERTFNLTVFRQVVQSDGSTKRDSEATFKELSMDPASANYAPRVLTEQSDLISAEADPTIAPLPGGANVSESGLIFSNLKTFFDANMTGTDPRLIMISVAHGATVPVDLKGLFGLTAESDVVTGIQDKINAALLDNGQTATVAVAATAAAGGKVLQISSANGPVVITSAVQSDAAALLRLGAANGGLETDRYSVFRPAPNGVLTRVHSGNSVATAFSRVHSFADETAAHFGDWKLVGAGHNATATPALVAGKLAADASLTGIVGSLAALRASLDAIVTSINNVPASGFKAYRAGVRLGVRPQYGNQDADLSLALTSTGTFKIETAGQVAQSGVAPTNVVRYGLGLPLPPGPATPGGAYRAAPQAGNNGEPPLPADYEYSWDKLERTADIFNLLVLPRAQGTAIRQSDADRMALWGAASAFCNRRRAFLIVDPPSDAGAGNWSTANLAAAGILAMRSGVVTDHAALYWPRVVASDSKGKPIVLDPSGTMAGVYANTDVRRGIWKAPAGLEATLVGVSNLEFAVTNPENGVTNPQAINTLRTMVSGATSWGARTMMGYDGAPDQDYRYVPVRRLALYIEESLYRGLQFAVFEPNGETLWGQIRLAAGAFMNGLFRQGAFKGLKASDAYYVACDASTTTQTDINLGQVNVEVGFAPLKPAEFVIVTVKQLAGQIEV